MVELGSDAWIGRFASQLAGLDAGSLEIAVHHQIVDGPAWVVRATGGEVSVERASSAAATAADITFTWQHEDAEAVARGEASPLAAFQAGRLRVGGDLRRLRDAVGLFARFPPVASGA